MEPLLFTLVVFAICVAVLLPAKLWFRHKWRTAHREARRTLERLAERRDGKYRPGEHAHEAGTVRLSLADCPCRGQYDISRPSRRPKQALRHLTTAPGRRESSTPKPSALP